MTHKYNKALGDFFKQIANSGYQEDEETTKRLEQLEQIRDRLCDGDKNDPMRADFTLGTMMAIHHQVVV